MPKIKLIKIIAFTFLYVIFISPKTVFAYLDPGAGSHILQLILGLVLGAIFSLKFFWKKMKILLKKFLDASLKHKQHS